jgi:hypothetical protein
MDARRTGRDAAGREAGLRRQFRELPARGVVRAGRTRGDDNGGGNEKQRNMSGHFNTPEEITTVPPGAPGGLPSGARRKNRPLEKLHIAVAKAAVKDNKRRTEIVIALTPERGDHADATCLSSFCRMSVHCALQHRRGAGC